MIAATSDASRWAAVPVVPAFSMREGDPDVTALRDPESPVPAALSSADCVRTTIRSSIMTCRCADLWRDQLPGQIEPASHVNCNRTACLQHFTANLPAGGHAVLLRRTIVPVEKRGCQDGSGARANSHARRSRTHLAVTRQI